MGLPQLNHDAYTVGWVCAIRWKSAPPGCSTGHVDVMKSFSEKGLDPNSIGEDHTASLLAAVHGRRQ